MNEQAFAEVDVLLLDAFPGVSLQDTTGFAKSSSKFVEERKSMNRDLKLLR